jgi:hypothetical protein
LDPLIKSQQQPAARLDGKYRASPIFDSVSAKLKRGAGSADAPNEKRRKASLSVGLLLASGGLQMSALGKSGPASGKVDF